MAEISYEEAIQDLMDAQYYLALAKRNARRNWGDFWFLIVSVGLGFLFGEWAFRYFEGSHALLIEWLKSYTNISNDYETLRVASGLSSRVFLVLLCMLAGGFFSTYLWAIWSSMKNWGLFRDNSLLDNVDQEFKVDHYYDGIHTGTTFERAGCISGLITTVLTPVFRLLFPVIFGLIFIVPLFVYRTIRVLFRLISKHVALKEAKETFAIVDSYITSMDKMRQRQATAAPVPTPASTPVSAFVPAPVSAPVYNGVADGRYYTYVPPKQ